MPEPSKVNGKSAEESVDTTIQAKVFFAEAAAEVSSQSAEGPIGPAPEPVSDPEAPRVSARKVEANRQNSQKSTGPKTPQGKANSRGNALKDGLFAMVFPAGTFTRTEDPAEYQDLLEQLRRQHEPVGIAEDLEVQMMCASLWRLRRAWRCETAEISSTRFALATVEQRVRDEDEACLEDLSRMLDEVKATGDIPPDLAEKIFEHEYLGAIWKHIETMVRGDSGEESEDLDPEQLQKALEFAILSLKKKPNGQMDIAYDLAAIPQLEVQNRILRSIAAAERTYHRACERLQRLQKRRKG